MQTSEMGAPRRGVYALENACHAVVLLDVGE
jgi:hypothetical protein